MFIEGNCFYATKIIVKTNVKILKANSSLTVGDPPVLFSAMHSLDTTNLKPE